MTYLVSSGTLNLNSANQSAHKLIDWLERTCMTWQMLCLEWNNNNSVNRSALCYYRTLSIYSSLLYLDTVGWIAGRTCSQLSGLGSLPQHIENKTEMNWLIHSHQKTEAKMEELACPYVAEQSKHVMAVGFVHKCIIRTLIICLFVAVRLAAALECEKVDVWVIFTVFFLFDLFILLHVIF